MSCCGPAACATEEANCALLWVPLLPILGALICAFIGNRVPKLTGWIATAAVFLSFLTAAPIAWNALHGMPSSVVAWQFIKSENLNVSISFMVDALTGVMLFVVLGVGTLIHLFSIEYMAHDRSVARYFAYLNMFIAFMLLLILGDNLFLLFVGWEGVGLASYCLIGFWYDKEAPPKAGMKAFLVNRIGDLGFLMGLLLLAYHTGSASFADIARATPELVATTVPFLGHNMALTTVVAGLLFLGACGKSAQFPLHVWLPDAMEGPTPVSALIHAATMVTAGVYMTARLDVIFAEAVTVRELMLIVAVITSLGAAAAALAQTDLKRILAYSTISQLGYMMAGVAAGAREAAVFHLATHAVFKALLFLSAGSIMHALSGELDIRKMGGLFRRIPATSTMLVIGALGLAGCPFLAGFYSKDLIIVEVAEHHPAAAALLILGALLTAFYSARMVMVALFGSDRLDRHAADHCHESGMVVLIPLALLAGATFIVGKIHIPEMLGLEHHPHVTWAATGALVAALGGMIAGALYYRGRVPGESAVSKFAKSGFGLDALYDRLFIRPLLALAKWSRDIVDAVFIDSVAQGLANMTLAIGESMRSFQSGNLGTYLCYMAGGLAMILWVIR